MMQLRAQNNFAEALEVLVAPMLTNGEKIYDKVIAFLNKVAPGDYIDDAAAEKLSGVKVYSKTGGWNPALYVAKETQGYNKQKMAETITAAIDKKQDKTVTRGCDSPTQSMTFEVKNGIFDNGRESRDIEIEDQSYFLFTAPPAAVLPRPSVSDKY
ncbi:MAG: hypothetical protein V4691_06015 [Pseudomonadota bacterium]